MDLGWIGGGSGVDLGWIWNGSGVDLEWSWSGSGVDLVWIWGGSGRYLGGILALVRTSGVDLGVSGVGVAVHIRFRRFGLYGSVRTIGNR